MSENKKNNRFFEASEPFVRARFVETLSGTHRMLYTLCSLVPASIVSRVCVRWDFPSAAGSARTTKKNRTRTNREQEKRRRRRIRIRRRRRRVSRKSEGATKKPGSARSFALSCLQTPSPANIYKALSHARLLHIHIFLSTRIY